MRLLLLMTFLLASPAAMAAETSDFATGAVVDLIQEVCVACHGDDKTEAGINFSQFNGELDVWRDQLRWKSVLNVIEQGAMPPDGELPLKDSVRESLARWIQHTINNVDISKIPRDPGFVPPRRLNRHEYNYTIQDLFDVSIRPAEDFPQDQTYDDGFDNDATALTLEGLWLESALNAAEEVVRVVWSDEDALSRLLFIRPSRPADVLDESDMDRRIGEAWVHLLYDVEKGSLSEHEAKQRIIALAQEVQATLDAGQEETEHISAEQAAMGVLQRFLRRAFRREPVRDELARYIGLFQTSSDAGLPFSLAMQLPVTAALTSPQFLFRSEFDGEAAGPYAISSIELANRLSYFLWSSMPDEELLAAGIEGRLSDPIELMAQTERLIDDARAERLFERFTQQWLRTEGLGEAILPDADLFPDVTPSLLAAMKMESAFVFGDMVRNNRSLLTFLSSSETFMNDELAQFYGYGGIGGGGWRRVPLRDDSRGGVLTQAAVLTVSSSPRRTSPVLRGTWILDVVLGERPPPPPPNVPALEATASGGATTMREMLEAHRANPSCARCHDWIDPLGFALEQYDAVGQLREGEHDTTATLPDGMTIDGAVGLKEVLLNQRHDSYIRQLTSKLLAFALGRELQFGDERTIQQIMKTLERENDGAKTLIRSIVMSDPFRFRMNPSAAAELRQEEVH
jgi:cytochrome c553